MLDPIDHEKRHSNGVTATLRFADGKWQQLPRSDHEKCNMDSSSDSHDLSIADTFTPQRDGTLVGESITTVVSDQCGELGEVTSVPLTMTRVGDAPAVALPAPVAYPPPPTPPPVPLLPVQVPDPKDLQFVSQLADRGIPTSDFIRGANGAAAIGHVVCELLAQGQTIDDVIDFLRQSKQDATLTEDQANQVAHTAIGIFCPNRS